MHCMRADKAWDLTKKIEKDVYGQQVRSRGVGDSDFVLLKILILLLGVVVVFFTPSTAFFVSQCNSQLYTAFYFPNNHSFFRLPIASLLATVEKSLILPATDVSSRAFRATRQSTSSHWHHSDEIAAIL